MTTRCCSFGVKNEQKLGLNLPSIIKARIELNTIDEINFTAKIGKYEGKVRFNLWDDGILQKALFRRDLQRKQVSLVHFRLIWPLVTNKKILMPLVNKRDLLLLY